MYKELDKKEFDYVIIGTSITESILSSYLAKCGKKVIHLDISKCYGGDCKNFSYKELDHYLTELEMKRMLDPTLNNLRLIQQSYTQENFSQNEKIREYNFDFNPKFLYGKSKSTEELSNTRASQYMEFVAMKKIYLHHDNKFLSIPCTKSEIFVSEDLQLSEKQKLLNFIYAVMKLKNKTLDVNTTVDIKKDYEVENKLYLDLKLILDTDKDSDCDSFLSSRFSTLLVNIIKIVLANLDPNSDQKISIDKLTDNIYKYLNSLLVYDVTPFIYPLYGSSEYSQALCRMSSVFGSIFIVNDTLSFEVYKNNESLVDESSKKFILVIQDSNCDGLFTISTDTIIVNESFVNSKNFVFQNNILEENVKIEMKKKIKQFISFHAIENNLLLRKHACPIFYKIPKNDSQYKNEFGFIVYEFDQNSYSAPKNRSLLQIIITSECEGESVFIETAQKIANNFASEHLEYIRTQIEFTLNNLDTLDKELKEKIESTDNALNTEVKLLASIQFYREVTQSDYTCVETENNCSNVIVTRNNFTENDIDFYYEEAEKILKAKQWDTLESEFKAQQELQGQAQASDIQNSSLEHDHNQNLIDELFDSIEINK